MSTCNRVDLQTLGSQLAMLGNLPSHWPRLEAIMLVNEMLVGQTCWGFVTLMYFH
jgi:hypothetical protein